MDSDWTIKLMRDEGLVIEDYLDRWCRTANYVLPMDYGERAAFVRLFGRPESANDGRCMQT